MRVPLKREKHLSTAKKTSAVELNKAGVPLSTIRKQLDMSRTTLFRVLVVAKKNPENRVTRMDDSTDLKNLIDSMPRRLQDVIRRYGGLIKY